MVVAEVVEVMDAISGPQEVVCTVDMVPCSRIVVPAILPALALLLASKGTIQHLHTSKEAASVLQWIPECSNMVVVVAANLIRWTLGLRLDFRAVALC
jgi:hypothetical protein